MEFIKKDRVQQERLNLIRKMFNDKNKNQRSNWKVVPSNVQTSKYESGSTIRSNEQHNCISISVPNYSVYSSGQNNEVEKVLIDKAELISFAQCFAQQKISLENMVHKLRQENRLISGELKRLRQENQSLKSMNQSMNKHNENTTQYYEAVQSLKSKMKQEFEKRLSAQRQLHSIQGVVFELRKKNEFLQDKMRHQEDQVQRCEQLLKIKEDIIQNLEWEKANSARKNIKEEKSVNKSNGEANKSSGKGYVVILPKNNQLNQTLDLSQIKLSDQASKQVNLNSSCPNNTANTTSVQKKPRYIINKRAVEQDSRKKLNISIHKKSSSDSVDQKRSQSDKHQKQKSKPKGIVLKKHLNNNSSFRQNNSSLRQQSSEHNNKEQQYLATISALQKQNKTLRAQLTQRSIDISHNKNEQNPLQPLNQNSQPPQTTTSYRLMQKKYNMIRQKCLLLQRQIQKTIRKYIVTEQRNQQLQQMIQYQSLNHSQCKPLQLNTHIEIQNNQTTKPGLSIQDLTTPQFRESKFSNNFFQKKPPNQNQWNHSQFNQISIQNYKLRQNSHLFETFEKNNHNHNYNNEQLSRINERNQVSHDLSRQFNEIEDVSEIVCRNQESIAMGDTLQL